MCSNKPAKVALELLPTDDDDSALEKLFQVHVSRILATHMNYFSFSFEDVVEKHQCYLSRFVGTHQRQCV